MSKSVDDILAKFAIQILGQSTGATSFGAEDFNVKQAFCTDLIELIGEDREWDTNEPYDNPDIAQGHNEALDELRTKIKGYLGIEGDE